MHMLVQLKTWHMDTILLQQDSDQSIRSNAITDLALALGSMVTVTAQMDIWQSAALTARTQCHNIQSNNMDTVCGQKDTMVMLQH